MIPSDLAYRFVLWTLFTVPLFLLSCNSSETLPLIPDAEIRLHRSECFGTCPVYDLVIFGNGIVQYEGFNHVQVKGVVESSISLDEMATLINSFEEIDFFALEDAYSATITDAPTYKTTLILDGREKTVSRYVCGPVELVDLEYLIDKIVGTEKWIGKPLEKWYPRESICTQHFNQFSSPFESPLETP